jgi:hypothetical protein
MLSAINRNTVRLRSEQVSAFVGIRTQLKDPSETEDAIWLCYKSTLPKMTLSPGAGIRGLDALLFPGPKSGWGS